MALLFYYRRSTFGEAKGPEAMGDRSLRLRSRPHGRSHATSASASQQWRRIICDGLYLTPTQSVSGISGQAKIRNGGSALGSPLEPIFVTAPAASKNEACFRSGQKQLENSHLASLVYIRDTLCRFVSYVVQFLSSS